MKLLIIGASGGLRRCLVSQALEQGHQVTAFVRRPDEFRETHPALSVTRGDILDAASLESAVAGAEVIVGAVAPKLKFRQNPGIFLEGVKNIAQLMSHNRGKCLIWVTGAGIDPVDLAATGFFFSRIFKPLFLQGVYTDCALSEDVLKKSGTQWIVIHPTRLTNGPRTWHRTDPWHTPPNGKAISRSDLADFILKQIQSDELLGKTPVIAIERRRCFQHVGGRIDCMDPAT